jgi:hypothetical protein
LSVPAEAACCCARVEAEACAGSSLTHRPCSLFFHVGASLPGGGGVDGACGMVNTGEDGAVEVEPTAPVAVRWRVTRNPCGSCERWLPPRAGGGVCDVHRSAKRCRVASSWTSALFPPRRVRSSSSGRGVAVVRLRGVAGAAWAAAPALAARGVSPDLRPVGGRGVLGDLGLANIPRIGALGRANPSELPPRVGLSSKPKVDRAVCRSGESIARVSSTTDDNSRSKNWLSYLLRSTLVLTWGSRLRPPLALVCASRVVLCRVAQAESFKPM